MALAHNQHAPLARGKPSWHTAWAEKGDPSFSVGPFLGVYCVTVWFLLVLGHSAFDTCSDPGGKMNTTTPRQGNLTDIFGDAMLRATSMLLFGQSLKSLPNHQRKKAPSSSSISRTSCLISDRSLSAYEDIQSALLLNIR